MPQYQFSEHIMSTESVTANEATGATLIRATDNHETLQINGSYAVTCVRIS